MAGARRCHGAIDHVQREFTRLPASGLKFPAPLAGRKRSVSRELAGRELPV